MATAVVRLYEEKRSYVTYVLGLRDDNTLELKVSRHAKNVFVPASEYSNFTSWNRETFDQFLQQLISKKYLIQDDVPPRLAQDLERAIEAIETVEGDLKKEIAKLKEMLSTEDNQKLELLRDNLEKAKTDYMGLDEKQKEQIEVLKKLSVEMKESLNSAVESYDYLTNGVGQFEEYEMNISAKQQKWKKIYGLCLEEVKCQIDTLQNSPFGKDFLIKIDFERVKGNLQALDANIQALLSEQSDKQHLDQGSAVLEQLNTFYIKWSGVLSTYAIHLTDHLYPGQEIQGPSEVFSLSALIDPKKKKERHSQLYIVTKRPQDDLTVIFMSQKEKEKIYSIWKKWRKEKTPLCNYPRLWECSSVVEDKEAMTVLTNLIMWVEKFIGDMAAQLRFRDHLKNREFYSTLAQAREETLIDRFYGIQEALKEGWASLRPYNDGLDLNDIEGNIDFLESILALMNSLEEVIESILYCINTRIHSSEFDLSYKEWDDWSKKKLSFLEEASIDISTLNNKRCMIKKMCLGLIKKLLDIQELRGEYQTAEKAYNIARTELTKLLEKIKKEIQDEPIKKFQQTPDHAQLQQSQIECLDKVVCLLRKSKLTDQENNKDKLTLIKERDGIYQKLYNAGSQSAESIDLAIDWERLNRKIKKKDEDIEAGQKKTATYFQGSISPPAESSPYAIACYTHTIQGARVTVPHPFLSPLIHLFSQADKEGGLKQIKGFVVPGHAQLSAFEKGVFKAFGKNHEKTVIPLTLQQHINSSTDSLAISSHAEVEFPGYYDVFRWEDKRSGVRTLTEPFPPSFNNVYTLLVLALASVSKKIREKNPSLPQGHHLGALIVSPMGEIISWAINTNETDLVRHAEVNALGAYFKTHHTQATLPPGCVLFTSLKSCHMCSGAIYDHMHLQSQNDVVYAQTDPTQKNTILESESFEIQSLLDVAKKIDNLYNDLKKKNPKINAANGLGETEFADLRKEVVLQLTQELHQNKENDVLVKHIKNFWDHLTS